MNCLLCISGFYKLLISGCSLNSYLLRRTKGARTRPIEAGSELPSHKLNLEAFQFFYTEGNAKESDGRFTSNTFAENN